MKNKVGGVLQELWLGCAVNLKGKSWSAKRIRTSLSVNTKADRSSRQSSKHTLHYIIVNTENNFRLELNLSEKQMVG